MKIRISWLMVGLIGLTVTSCTSQKEKKMSNPGVFFKQVTGTWRVEGENSFEEWEMEPDSSFHALSYTMEGNDTLIAEKINIAEEDGKFYYEATVVNQNEGRPIRFEMTVSSADEVVFINSKHDFPQEIRYSLFDQDHMKAVISGKVNEEEKSYVFKFTRHMKQKKVTGIGGIFFKSEDPERMRDWYSKNLGLVTNEYGSLFEFRESDHPERKAYLQWSPFDENTEYFEPSQKEFMINYRVENIEALVEELKNSGVTVLDSIETYEYGKFVHILDPENNKIELWEPVDNSFTQSYEGETTK